jgi:hypothetical protein
MCVLEGLDHIQAMQAAQIVPIIRPWLLAQLIEQLPLPRLGKGKS